MGEVLPAEVVVSASNLISNLIRVLPPTATGISARNQCVAVEVGVDVGSQVVFPLPLGIEKTDRWE